MECLQVGVAQPAVRPDTQCGTRGPGVRASVPTKGAGQRALRRAKRGHAHTHTHAHTHRLCEWIRRV
eukprot:1980300-Prymnesium_polylepis.2